MAIDSISFIINACVLRRDRLFLYWIDKNKSNIEYFLNVSWKSLQSQMNRKYIITVATLSAKYVIRTTFDVTTKPDVETTLVIGSIWKFPGRLFTSRRFHDVVTMSFTSRCRHNLSTTFATSEDVQKTFIDNQISMFCRRRVSTGCALNESRVDKYLFNSWVHHFWKRWAGRAVKCYVLHTLVKNALQSKN